MFLGYPESQTAPRGAKRESAPEPWMNGLRRYDFLALRVSFEKKQLCWLVGWVGLGWVGLGWVGLGWVGLGWVGLGWVGLGWVGLGWVGLVGWLVGGLGWVGLGWVGLGWVGLGWVGWLVGWVGWLVGWFGWLYFVFHAFLSFIVFSFSTGVFWFGLVFWRSDLGASENHHGHSLALDSLDLRARTAVLWSCRRGHFHPMNFWWKKTEVCRSLPGKPLGFLGFSKGIYFEFMMVTCIFWGNWLFAGYA